MSDIARFTLEGHIPSKKNSKKLVRQGSRTIPISSKAYRDWEEKTLNSLRGTVDPFPGPVSIAYEFYPGSLKLFDLSNSIEGINDLLVSAGILPDDNWAIVRDIHPKVCGFDRGNERCVVTIRSLARTSLDEALEVLRDRDIIRQIAADTGRTQKAVTAHYEEIARGAA